MSCMSHTLLLLCPSAPPLPYNPHPHPEGMHASQFLVLTSNEPLAPHKGKQCIKMTFIITHKIQVWNAGMQQFGVFMSHVVSSNQKKKKGSLGHFTFHLVARSWKVAVLSLTHCHESTSVCHTTVVKLWHFDESTVSACWYRVYDTIPSPSAIRWHILQNCQNTFEVVQIWVQAATSDRKILKLEMESLTYLIYVDTIQSGWLFVAILSKNYWI